MAQLRLSELRQSCKILGVTDLELLGYHDSGMPDWDYKDRPEAFCNIPQAEVAARIGGLIEAYRPQVVITYDDNGLYQHPDHVHASRSAQAAVAATGIPAKLYLSALRGSDWQKLSEALREQGIEVPEREFTPRDAAEDGRRRGAHHHDGRHPAAARPQAGRAARARQPDPGFVVQPESRRRSRRPCSAASTSSGRPTRPARQCPRMTCSRAFARADRRPGPPGGACGRPSPAALSRLRDTTGLTPQGLRAWSAIAAARSRVGSAWPPTRRGEPDGGPDCGPHGGRGHRRPARAHGLGQHRRHGHRAPPVQQLADPLGGPDA